MVPETLRVLLLLYLVAAFGVAVAYLRRRRMTLRGYALWGMFALLLPAFGPFFLIAVQPGGGKSAGVAVRGRIRRR